MPRIPLLSGALVTGGLLLGLWLLPEISSPPTQNGTNPTLAGKALRESAPLRREPVLPMPENLQLDAAKVKLGRQLFHDGRLSRDGSVSCASCHDLRRGGVDGLARSVGVGGAVGGINAPSVLTAALNFRQFWDGRASTLEDQAAGPVHNPIEMNASWELVVPRLEADPEFRRDFLAAYPDGINGGNITRAIAEFERSLLTPSRFDRWLRGDDRALSRDELAGYRLFKRHGCIACHQGVNLGGNLYQRFGVMRDPFPNKQGLTSADLGRYNVTHKDEDRFVFKVPTLRNIALSAPYFHDGSSRQLDEAVRIMGWAQLGIALPEADVEQITLFLHTLTGEKYQ